MIASVAAAFQQAPPAPWFVRVVAFFQVNALGVLMILLSAFAVGFLIQWLMWGAGIGRFKAAPRVTTSESMRFVFSDALVKIIDDFKHLLALIVVSIFAGAIIWALAVAGNDPDQMTRSLQAVVSTLGGLVGSIIGYYFGESSGRAQTRGAAGGGQGGEQRDPDGGGGAGGAADPAGDTGAAPVSAPPGIRPAPQPPPSDPGS